MHEKWQLPVEQYVSIAFNGSAEVLSIIQQHESLLQANVLVKAIHYGEEWPHAKSIETALFNENSLCLSLYKRNAQGFLLSIFYVCYNKPLAR